MDLAVKQSNNKVSTAVPIPQAQYTFQMGTCHKQHLTGNCKCRAKNRMKK